MDRSARLPTQGAREVMMSIRSKFIAAAFLGGMLVATTASAAPAAEAGRSCFTSRDWTGWSASADGDALYLRVGLRDIYRVELNRGARVRKYADQFLVSQVRGSDWISSALDLDLTISDHQ